MLDASFLDAIKKFEGYSAKARWDYAQNTNGYGTRAQFAGEVVDKAEADKRFTNEISKAAAFVEKFAPNLDAGSKAALTSLTYNAGTAWSESGLGEAVASGDLDKARTIFLQYNKAGGSVLDGLVQRRLQEVSWFGAGNPVGQVASAATGAAAASSGAFSLHDEGEASSAGMTSLGSGADAMSNTSPTADSFSASQFSGLSSDALLLALLSKLTQHQPPADREDRPQEADAQTATSAQAKSV